MKSSILKVSMIALAILLMGFNASAQSRSERRIQEVEGLYTLESGKVTMTRIIEVPGKSVGEIFSLIETTLRLDNIGARYYILSDDNLKTAMVAEGYYQAFYKRKPRSRTGQTTQVENTLHIYIQDGRMQIVMTLDNYVNDLIGTVAVSSIYPINDKTTSNRMIVGNRYTEQPSILKADASKYFNAAISTGTEVLKNIETQIKKDNSNW